MGQVWLGTLRLTNNPQYISGESTGTKIKLMNNFFSLKNL